MSIHLHGLFASSSPWPPRDAIQTIAPSTPGGRLDLPPSTEFDLLPRQIRPCLVLREPNSFQINRKDNLSDFGASRMGKGIHFCRPVRSQSFLTISLSKRLAAELKLHRPKQKPQLTTTNGKGKAAKHWPLNLDHF
jgi:hypothetical protein